jgi:hypothetical protein
VLATVKALAESPWSAQAETDAKPSPAPNVNRINESDTATAAPAKMAPHEAAEFAFRRAPSSSGGDAEAVPIMMAAQRCEHMASRRMTGRGTPNIHNRIPRPMTTIPQEVLYEMLIYQAQAWSDFRDISMAANMNGLSERADSVVCP